MMAVVPLTATEYPNSSPRTPSAAVSSCGCCPWVLKGHRLTFPLQGVPEHVNTYAAPWRVLLAMRTVLPLTATRVPNSSRLAPSDAISSCCEVQAQGIPEHVNT